VQRYREDYKEIELVRGTGRWYGALARRASVAKGIKTSYSRNIDNRITTGSERLLSARYIWLS
jgi:hypothetical protein